MLNVYSYTIYYFWHNVHILNFFKTKQFEANYQSVQIFMTSTVSKNEHLFQIFQKDVSFKKKKN